MRRSLKVTGVRGEGPGPGRARTLGVRGTLVPVWDPGSDEKSRLCCGILSPVRDPGSGAAAAPVGGTRRGPARRSVAMAAAAARGALAGRYRGGVGVGAGGVWLGCLC